MVLYGHKSARKLLGHKIKSQPGQNNQGIPAYLEFSQKIPGSPGSL